MKTKDRIFNRMSLLKEVTGDNIEDIYKVLTCLEKDSKKLDALSNYNYSETFLKNINMMYSIGEFEKKLNSYSYTYGSAEGITTFLDLLISDRNSLDGKVDDKYIRLSESIDDSKLSTYSKIREELFKIESEIRVDKFNDVRELLHGRFKSGNTSFYKYNSEFSEKDFCNCYTMAFIRLKIEFIDKTRMILPEDIFSEWRYAIEKLIDVFCNIFVTEFDVSSNLGEITCMDVFDKLVMDSYIDYTLNDYIRSDVSKSYRSRCVNELIKYNKKELSELNIVNLNVKEYINTCTKFHVKSSLPVEIVLFDFNGELNLYKNQVIISLEDIEEETIKELNNLDIYTWIQCIDKPSYNKVLKCLGDSENKKILDLSEYVYKIYGEGEIYVMNKFPIYTSDRSDTDIDKLTKELKKGEVLPRIVKWYKTKGVKNL